MYVSLDIEILNRDILLNTQVCKCHDFKIEFQFQFYKLFQNGKHFMNSKDFLLQTTDYGPQESKQPSLHGRKFTPTPKFLGKAEAYFVCHIGPDFRIFLIYVFHDTGKLKLKCDFKNVFDHTVNHIQYIHSSSLMGVRLVFALRKL